MPPSPSQRPRPLAPEGRPLTPTAAALWAVALTMTLVLAVQLTQMARAGAESDIVNLAACQALATSLVIFALVRWHVGDGSLRAALSLRPIRPIRGILSIAAGAGLFPLMSTVEGAILRRWPMDDPAALESVEKLVASSSRGALVVGALVVVPIARELFFRGALYRGLRESSGARVALGATAILYACSSLDARQLPTALLMGLALAWLRERTGTVLAPLLGQLAYGAVEGIPILAGRDPSADVTYPTRWIAGGAIIAVLALAAVGTGRDRED